MHTLSESKSVLAIEQKDIVSCFVKHVACLLGHPVVQNNENLHQLLFHNRLRIILREKLQTSFIEEWDTKTANMSKLSFYRQYKPNRGLKNCIVLVNNRRHRSALTKLRCSAHRLKIEIGRYSRIYNDDAKRYEQLPREKRTCDTCKNNVEDELHFLLECPLNEEIRHNFLQKIDKVTTEDFQSWSDTDKISFQNNR